MPLHVTSVSQDAEVRSKGRTDEQLRERLESKPNMSAASTYPDRETAERVVGTALWQEQAEIWRWRRAVADTPTWFSTIAAMRHIPLGAW